eukprot:scaffold37841_cov54-Phaeocystis_antarctica.AAC.1
MLVAAPLALLHLERRLYLRVLLGCAAAPSPPPPRGRAPPLPRAASAAELSPAAASALATASTFASRDTRPSSPPKAGRAVCSCSQDSSTHGESALADALAARQSDSSSSSGRSPSRTLMEISVMGDSSSAHGSWRVSTCQHSTPKAYRRRSLAIRPRRPASCRETPPPFERVQPGL